MRIANLDGRLVLKYPNGVTDLKPPAPRPSQVFAIGVNYADHAAEGSLPLPPEPAVFTKFQTSITGPNEVVVLPTATVDWEAELVVVIGRRAVGVDAAWAWDHVAGFTVGHDLSERTRQLVGTPPQFSIGRPRRPRNRLQRQRRDRPARPHQRPHLLRRLPH